MSVLLAIWDVIKLILAFFGLYKEAKDAAEVARRAEAEQRTQQREKAVEDSKVAETDEEIWDSQDRIVRNRPKP